MGDLESWLDKVYASGGDRDTLDNLYDEWALAYDQQIWASGNPYIVIQAGFVGRHVRDLMPGFSTQAAVPATWP